MLVREHTPHHLAHVRGRPLRSDVTGTACRTRASESAWSSAIRRAPAAAAFFCGAYQFDGDLCQGLLEALPDTLRVRPGAGSTLRATMDLLAGEMLRDEPGQQTLLDRLLDVALVQILREHFATAQASAPGWFRASADPRIGPALQALHANPGHAWTVAELAEHALMSRSAFARQFTELLGVPPLALSQRLADGARPGTSARHRCAAGLDRRVAGLRVGVLVRRRVQAPPRDRPGTLARVRPSAPPS